MSIFKHLFYFSVRVEQLMSQLIRERQHIALVYDEYGGWMGVVIIEDVIASIIAQPNMDETDDTSNIHRFAMRRREHKQKQLTKNDHYRASQGY